MEEAESGPACFGGFSRRSTLRPSSEASAELEIEQRKNSFSGGSRFHGCRLNHCFQIRCLNKSELGQVKAVVTFIRPWPGEATTENEKKHVNHAFTKKRPTVEIAGQLCLFQTGPAPEIMLKPGTKPETVDPNTDQTQQKTTNPDWKKF